MAASVHPALAEQFDDLEQQRRAATFGMWVFLMTEVMLFGGMITGYTVYRFLYTAGFTEGTRHMELIVGGINTAVLLTSSLMMALAVHSAQTGQRRALTWFLAATIALGVLFIVLKGYEYWRHWEDQLVPGLRFTFAGPLSHQVELFFLFYFIMTGIHAIHLTIGVGLVSVILWMARHGKFSPEAHNSVEVVGLYWHFVDIVWLFLLPLLYLFGLS